jgi:hypothetical protein
MKHMHALPAEHFARLDIGVHELNHRYLQCLTLLIEPTPTALLEAPGRLSRCG